MVEDHVPLGRIKHTGNVDCSPLTEEIRNTKCVSNSFHGGLHSVFVSHFSVDGKRITVHVLFMLPDTGLESTYFLI